MNEFDQIRSMVNGFNRCPDQLNEVFRSDAEILRLGSHTLAITVDTMVDEIDLGIYTDPYEIGFSAVMSSVADITASGAGMIGILVSLELPHNMDQADKKLLQDGIYRACEINNTYLLGGDTNWSDRIRVGVVAVGSYEGSGPVMRTGLKPGDALFVSGKLGGGNANAINSLLLGGKSVERILPSPTCEWGKVLADHGSAGTDTSDGFFTALYNLGMVNEVSFEITAPITDLLEPTAIRIAAEAGVPPAFLLAGPVGEYELVFTVPEVEIQAFLKEINYRGLEVIRCGVITRRVGTGMKLNINQKVLPLDAIIEGQQEAASDIKRVLDNLFKYDFF